MQKLFSRKKLQRLRLTVEIRGFPETGIFSCHQQLGLQYFTYSLSKPVSLTYFKKCQKYGKLLHILGLLLHKIFFCRKTKTTRRKNTCSASKTKQKCILTHVLTNTKTCISINPQFVAFLRLLSPF